MDPNVAAAAPVSRDALVGIDQLVPLFDGRLVPYVNLDNAASTPALRSVVETIEEFMPFYSGVHRGTGYKSRVSTNAFERARELVGEFLGADPERDVVVFAKNTTEAINRLARSLAADDDAVVLTTMLEHHSNDLPWRGTIPHRPRRCLPRRHAGRRRPRSASRRARRSRRPARGVGCVERHRGRAAGARVGRQGSRGRRSHRRRRRSTRSAPPDRHAAARRSRPPRLRRPVGPQAVRAVRHRSARRCAMRVRRRTRPRGRRHGARRHDRRRSPGPTSPTGRRPAARTFSVRWRWPPPPAPSSTSGSIASPTTSRAHAVRDPIAWRCARPHASTARPRPRVRTARSASSRSRSPGSTTGSSPRSSATSTASGFAADVSARIRTSPTSSRLDRAKAMAWIERREQGRQARRARHGPDQLRLLQRSAATSIAPFAALERVVAGDHAADYRADLDGSFHPAGYVEPLLFSLDRG